MSAPTPQKSPHELAEAEMTTLNQTIEHDLDNFGTALLSEYETRMSILRTSFNKSQQSAIANIKTVSKASDERIRNLEQSLRAGKEHVVTLTDKLSAQKQEAKSKHDQVIVELASQKLSHEWAKTEYKKAKKGLEDANQKIVDLQAELEVAKRQPADLQDRLNAVEYRNADLKADLKAATQRASTAEDELKVFKTRWNQINDIMTASGSSSNHQPPAAQPTSSSQQQPSVPQPGASQQQLVVAQPTSSTQQQPTVARPDSPALESNQEGSLDEREGALQTNDSPIRTQSLDPHVSDDMSEKEPDFPHCQSILNAVMDVKNRQFNQYFLNPVDLAAPNGHADLAETTQPLNLDTMKEKLDKGTYDSVNSFKADFELMIADCKGLFPSGSLVFIAAEQLSSIFERTWSAQRASSHQDQDTESSSQESRVKKRKAETQSPVSSEDGHIEKRRSLTPLDNDIDYVQPMNTDRVENKRSASSSSVQSNDTSNDPIADDTYAMKGQLTAGARLDIEANFEVLPRLVSVMKSPNTLPDRWESLIPDEYRLTAHAVPSTVEKRLDEVAADLSSGMAIFRLTPASDADNVEFNRIFEYFIDKQRFASVSHAGLDDVEDIYLIPISKTASYPDSWLTLDTNLLPPAMTEDVLFMVVTFHLSEDKYTQVLKAWDDLFKAIQNPDFEGLAAIDGHLVNHQLPFFAPLPYTLSRVEFRMPKYNRMGRSEALLDHKLQGIAQNILRISKSEFYQSSRPSVNGIELPECVFVLGRVIQGRKRRGFLVVDIQHRDRPLWMIPQVYKAHSRPRDVILLRSKSPGSLGEWEGSITAKLLRAQLKKMLKVRGLVLERYSLPQ